MPTLEELTAARFPLYPDEDLPKLFRAVGCSACGKTGYKGRMAIHEVMTVSEEIERMVAEKASSESIGRVAIEQGMITLREDGMQKVRAGSTSIEEILRVIV